MSLIAHLSDNDRFHGFNLDYQNRSLNNAVREGRITPTDASLISSFVAERKITNNIGPKRALKLTSNLVTVRRFIPPFKEMTISDLYQGIDRIHYADSLREKTFTVNTQIDLISIIKQFTLWLLDNDEIHISEKKVKAIKRPKPVATKKASDLLTNDEIQALLSACVSSRDRAIIITLYEGGFRIGEIGEMKWGSLKFDGTGIIANVTFKTGKVRYLRLVMAKEFLIKWKSDYPTEITDDSLVFLNERLEPLTHAAVNKQIHRIAARAGITKHITPHIFRHTRITHLIQQGVNESVIKLMMWGSVTSNMFMYYAHLAGSDIDNEIFKLYGIDPKVSQITKDTVEPRVCPHCKEINSPISRHCHICGQDLTKEAVNTIEEFNKFIKENPELLYNYLKTFSPE